MRTGQRNVPQGLGEQLGLGHGGEVAAVPG